MKTFITWFTAFASLLGWLAPAAHAQTCLAPTNVSLSSTTATTAVVSFVPNTSALAYVVRYYWTGDSTAAGIKRLIAPSSPVTLTGLRPASAYRLLVGSICRPGDTLYSAPRSFVTASGGSSAACGPVTNVQITNLSSIGATLSFAPVNGASSYTISYYASGDTTNILTLTTTSPGAVLGGLLPATTYRVWVKATCSGGTTSAPALITFRTLANPATCGAVTNVAVTATSSSTASVSFTPGAGNVSFFVTYHVANDSTRRVYTTTSPAVLTGLVQGQTYYIQVVSQCGSSASTVYSGGGSVTYNFRGAGPLSSRNALEAGSVALFPNPAHQAVGLRLSGAPGATAQVSLFNALGQPLRIRQLALGGSTTEVQLDLVGVAPGLYTVRVAIGEKYASQRLVVE